MGEAPESIRLVQTVDGCRPGRGARPVQGGLSHANHACRSTTRREIIERLRQRFPQIVGPARDDICYATQNRQEAVRVLAREADVVLVVGSQNSSNSRRLAELARACGVAAHLIDGPADIDLGWFSPKSGQGDIRQLG